MLCWRVLLVEVCCFDAFVCVELVAIWLPLCGFLWGGFRGCYFIVGDGVSYWGLLYTDCCSLVDILYSSLWVGWHVFGCS